MVVADVCSNDPDGFGEYIIGGLDLDGDAQNRPDFVIADGINRRIGVFDHQEQSIDCFGRSRSLYGNITEFAGDIDGDGVEEFLAGAKGENFKNGNWFAYWERGDDVNKPWKRVTIAGTYEGATHIYPADVNMDGKMDLVTSQGHDKGILWFEGPDFNAHKIDDKLIHPHAMQIADMDNDGDIDVVACANYSAKAQWFENDGKGNFTRHHLLDNQKSYDITISDLDNDGLLDVIIAGWKGGNVMLLKQQ